MTFPVASTAWVGGCFCSSCSFDGALCVCGGGGCGSGDCSLGGGGGGDDNCVCRFGCFSAAFLRGSVEVPDDRVPAWRVRNDCDELWGVIDFFFSSDNFCLVFDSTTFIEMSRHEVNHSSK